MITVTTTDDHRISVFVSPDETSNVKLVLESMLNARYNTKTGTFFIPIHDFHSLQSKLGQLGIPVHFIDGRVDNLLQVFSREVEIDKLVKAGGMDHEIKPYLAGVMKSQLWEDQVSDVRFCLRRRKAGVFSEMGTGKTAVVLAAFSLLKLAGLARFALVVCPNSVKQTWLEQVRRHTKLTATELGNGYSKQSKNFGKYMKHRVDVCVVHFDAIRDKRLRQIISAAPFDIVVIDEAHAIKNMSSKRSQALLDLLKNIRTMSDVVEAEIESEDGTITMAVLPSNIKPGDVVEFW